MASDEITQIRIDGFKIGIIGLQSALAEAAASGAGLSDAQIIDLLLERLEKRNYIPDTAREGYGAAFLREFKKFTGRPVTDVPTEGVVIKVLGPGCARCNQLEQDLMAVLTQLNMAADIEHVTDIAEIGSYGVMGTPALIINNEVKSVGTVPPRAKLRAWLTDARQKP